METPKNYADEVNPKKPICPKKPSLLESWISRKVDMLQKPSFSTLSISSKRLTVSSGSLITIPSPFSRRSGGTQWNPTFLLAWAALHPTYKEQHFYFGENIV
jgi:hypothetical protein